MSFAGDIGRMVAEGQNRPLTNKETELLIYCSMMGHEEQQVQIQMYHDAMKASGILRIMDARFRLHFGDQQKFSPPLIVWFSFLAQGNPGNAILLLTVMKYLLDQKLDLTLNNAIEYCFCDGIPTEINFRQAWQNQKHTSSTNYLFLELPPGTMTDNCLDIQRAWE